MPLICGFLPGHALDTAPSLRQSPQTVCSRAPFPPLAPQPSSYCLCVLLVAECIEHTVPGFSGHSGLQAECTWPRNRLRSSRMLYWGSPPSCANRIRALVFYRASCIMRISPLLIIRPSPSKVSLLFRSPFFRRGAISSRPYRAAILRR